MIIQEYQEYNEKLIEALNAQAKFVKEIAEVERRFMNLQHNLELAEIYQREAEMLKPQEN